MGLVALLVISASIQELHAGVTGVALVSESGAGVGARNNFELVNFPYFYVPGSARIALDRNDRNGITVSVNQGSDWWVIDFIGPGNAPLAVGSYTDAVSKYSTDTVRPAMYAAGNGLAAGTLTGQFTIFELTYDENGLVTSLHMLFQQTESQTIASLWGEIWFNSAGSLPPSRIGAVRTPVGQPMSWKIPAGLRVGNYHCKGLPAGLSCDSTTGIISGTPTTFGDFPLYYQVDSDSGPIAGTVVLRIAPPADVTSTILHLTSDADPTDKVLSADAATGVVYATYITTDFPEVRLFFANQPPPFVEPTGEFGWNYFIDGVFFFIPAAQSTLQVGVYPNVSASFSDTLPVLLNSTSYVPVPSENPQESFQINEIEYGGPNGQLVRFSANFAMLSPIGYHNAMTGQIRLNAQLHIDSARTISGAIGQPLTYQIAANNSPTLFWSSRLPAGLSLDSSTGIISGTPTQNGYSLTTISAMGTGGIAAATVSFEISPLPPVITSPRRMDALVGEPLKYQLTSLNGPVTYSVTNVAPLSFNAASGTISGTSSKEISVGLTATATNAYGSYSLPILLNFNNQPFILSNVSTRGHIQTGDNVLIGGFIITGDKPKPVIVRAIGPSLATDYSYLNPIADPTLELHDSSGRIIAFNDNWMDSQASAIQASTYAPTDPREPAILTTLAPGEYTAIVRGKNNTSGVGLVEVWDLDTNASRLANISTRGRVEDGNNVLIGGFICGHISGAKVLIRAIAPTLAGAGVPAGELLQDPESGTRPDRIPRLTSCRDFDIRQ